MKVFELTCELYREYDIPGRNEPYRIDKPVRLFISDSGTTHRVLDSDDMVHCIPFGPGMGTVLRWKPANPDQPVAF